ncbi:MULTISPECIES: hypothetical protein [unclassified Corallococcus]|uniref:hypothetical protein n=1 Tax=unclassified Corallococcus TaxID=2685029 RepID=UPI001A8D0EDA|nr:MULTISPECIES: hypothetical protein [unclassified Corallococcus]MBN9685394.1 hypothetical protein [Corallococcus sp. NCSPR001]WAS83155.1 hypothetical protein O0N60_28020 [Corallococcus sp. NCRR]
MGFQLIPGAANVQRYPVDVVLNGNTNDAQTVTGPGFFTHSTLITTVQVIQGRPGDEWELTMQPADEDMRLPALRTNRDGFTAMGTREPQLLFVIDSGDAATLATIISDFAANTFTGNMFVYFDPDYVKGPRLGFNPSPSDAAANAEAVLSLPAWDLRGYSHVLFTAEVEWATSVGLDDPQAAIIPCVDLCRAPGDNAVSFRTIEAGTGGNIGGAGTSPVPSPAINHGGRSIRRGYILLGAEESSQTLTATEDSTPPWPGVKFRLRVTGQLDSGNAAIWSSTFRLRITAQAW